MTCIVGYTNGKNVILGGDSAGVAGYSITQRKDKKVYKLNDNIVFGGAGSFRMIQVMGYSWTPPELDKSRDEMEYMVNSLVPSLIKLYGETGYLKKDHKGSLEGSYALVGVKARLFLVGYDFQVGESLNSYESIGCGNELALGSLATGIGNAKLSLAAAKEKLKHSLEVASLFSGGVIGPYNFVATNN